MMKNLLYSAKSGLSSMILVALFCLFGNFAANAQNQGKIVDIDFDTPVTVDSKNNYDIFKFTAPSSGLLTVTTNSYFQLDLLGANFMFYNEECTNPVPFASEREDNGKGYTYYYNVEGGVTYYISLREMALTLPSDFITFTISMQDTSITPRLIFIYPKYGEDVNYNFALGPELQLLWNIKSTDAEDIYLQYVDNDGQNKTFTLDWTILTDADNSWRINMQAMYKQIGDQIKKGSLMKVVIVNPMANGQHATGQCVVGNNVEIPYTFVPMTYAVTSTWPEKFLSYWPEGDPAGIATIVFSDNLKPISQQTDKDFAYELYAGNDMENEGGMTLMPAYKLSIDGNVMTLDFTGVLRETDEEVMSILITGVVDENGQPFFYEGNNQVWKEITYEALAKIILTLEWTPGEGASVANTNEVELWIEDTAWKHIAIDGFAWTCGDQTVNIDIEDCNVMPDPLTAGFSLIYIPVPEAVKNAAGKVALNGILRSLDGNEYELGVTFNNPESGQNGVEAIDAAEGSYNVFNLHGINILNTNSYRDVMTLPAGLYIVNGKKVVIK